MNGLALRISKGGSKKLRNSNGISPFQLSGVLRKHLVSGCNAENATIQQFFEANNTDEQLTVLKNVMDTIQGCDDRAMVDFLATVYFYAEAKHPVKCFIARHVTKSTTLPVVFSQSLATLIAAVLSGHSIYQQNEEQSHLGDENQCKLAYKDFVETVTKVAACIESFPAGVNAVRMIEVKLAAYLKECLRCCVETLRQTPLSPTEKNEIFSPSHTCLRLFLHITQKVDPGHTVDLILMFPEIRGCVKQLLFDMDVPMDTKSICGILTLNMRCLEKGVDCWIDILQPKTLDEDLNSLLSIDASKLSLFSAIATTVAMDRLQPFVLILCERILDIAESNSSESTFVLGATRTLVQISKSLDKISDSRAGSDLMAMLLRFTWGHLDHYMDSVRHLTAQLLANVVKYCARLKHEGNDTALNSLYSALTSLDRSRKSYYVAVTSLAIELGASSVMDRMPGLIRGVVEALSLQAVQASASTTLETLLQKHAAECDTQALYRTWIEPVIAYAAAQPLDSSVLNVLEGLLVKGVKLDGDVMGYILPHINGRTNQTKYDLKCVLMLLSVARKCNALDGTSSSDKWNGVIGYDVLQMAAVDAVDETRILSLSVIVESPKSTEAFTRSELDFVLHYLKYNLNAQSPNFRQLTLSLIKKFLKRLEDGYKVLKRENGQSDYVLDFMVRLREFCFDNLLEGANLSRRQVALQVLDWCDKLNLEGFVRTWKGEYVSKLLYHLEDSYESNKSLALSILEKCPIDILQDKTYSTVLDLESILRQASSLKPTECVSAAYKLDLLRTKLPERILLENIYEVPEPVSYALLSRLQTELASQVAVCKGSIVAGAVKAPMYGILHCMGHLVTRIDAEAISSSAPWSTLVSAVVQAGYAASAAAAPIVNSSSPEGHLPCDLGKVTDHGNSSGVTLDDGRQVTAQMVLLCAWRTVKEVSLLLGSLSTLTVSGEGQGAGSLSADQLTSMGQFFTSLLAETKHRGAFEQAYVGYTKLLARVWQCSQPGLHSLPGRWLAELMASIASNSSHQLCVTRRSAGLPFIIQALVTTELQVHGNPKCFHQCMTTLLHLARTPSQSTTRQHLTELETDSCLTQTYEDDNVETRTHAINILRALFRNASLDENVSSYVGEGLMVALQGFEGRTWMERNSSTLLFSALMVRVFGVQRSKDGDRLCVRNRMTGRIFFLRYPMLYDFMLNKLQEINASKEAQLLRPSLYPILLLLARLYPSALEGTVSNLKLVAFVPHVTLCAASCVLKSRQLAAKAMVPLVPPQRYVSHLEEMFKLICDVNIKRNYCHGILLQLIKLLENKPENFSIDGEALDRLTNLLEKTQWILTQAMDKNSCYLLTDEYVKVVNLILMRFPSLIQNKLSATIATSLEELLFRNTFTSENICGRDICLSNCLYLYFVLLFKIKSAQEVSDLINRSLKHDTYEVVLSTLNVLLILHGELNTENNFHEHIRTILNTNVLKALRANNNYLESLNFVLENNRYPECIQKTLRVLNFEENTQKYIVKIKLKTEKEISDEEILKTLFNCIENEHENSTHIYLESLCNFVTRKLKDSHTNGMEILDVIKVIFSCSSSDNSDDTRQVVVKFLENNYIALLHFDLEGLSKGDEFEYHATLSSTVVRLLEDDDSIIRQRIADIITLCHHGVHNSSHSTNKTIKPTEEKANLTDKKTPSEDGRYCTNEMAAENKMAVENKMARSASTPSVHRVISTRAAELLRDSLQDRDLRLVVVAALLDFKSEVCLPDELGDECRVFDTNERYNTYLEETVWTRNCAEILRQVWKENAVGSVQQIVCSPTNRSTFERLCGKHLYAFEDMLNDIDIDILNPKIRMFGNTLKDISSKVRNDK